MRQAVDEAHLPLSSCLQTQPQIVRILTRADQEKFEIGVSQGVGEHQLVLAGIDRRYTEHEVIVHAELIAKTLRRRLANRLAINSVVSKRKWLFHPTGDLG